MLMTTFSSLSLSPLCWSAGATIDEKGARGRCNLIDRRGVDGAVQRGGGLGQGRQVGEF